MKYYGLIIPSVFPTGVFIQDIKQTASSNESEGANTMTVTLTNHQKAYFHVKNGKQGSAAEATAQMEKHAKEYIASELKKQKEALEKAIENGKVVINNAIEEAIATAETTLIEKTNTNIIKLLQNGYIQWPGMPRPDSLFDFPGYRWAEVDYNGCFFRAKGAEANSFNSGEQGDAIRNIRGSFLSGRKIGTQEQKEYMQKHTTRCFYLNLKGVDHYATSTVNIGAATHVTFDASRSVPTAEENRPRNRTIIIWRLEKI